MENQDHSFFYTGTNGKGVLLIHGLTGSPSEMKYLGKKLHKQGFTVYAPVLAGHCQDVKTLLSTTWQDWYKSVEAAYKQFSAQVSEVYTAGICAGGFLGLNLAAEHPEIAGTATYSLAFRYDGWNMPQLHKLTTLLALVAGLPLVRTIKFAEKYPFGFKDERIRKRVQSGEVLVPGALDYFPMGGLNQLYHLSEQVRKVLPQIKSPAILMHAREDDMSHMRNSEYVANHIGGPHQLVLLEDSYHMIHVDQEREKVAELTGDFFSTHAASLAA